MALLSSTQTPLRPRLALLPPTAALLGLAATPLEPANVFLEHVAALLAPAVALRKLVVALHQTTMALPNPPAAHKW
jgi:hypothetical protein